MFKKIIFVFLIISVIISSDFVNAVSTIQTTTIQNVLNYSTLDKIVNIPDTGKIWFFYFQSSHIYFKTYDYTSWSSATQVSDPTTSLTYTYGQFMSINYDPTGNRIQLAFTGNSKKVYYREGTPYSNGTITWGSWRTAYDAGYSVDCVDVNVDTNGYPMITVANWGADTIEKLRATATDGSAWTSTSLFSTIHSKPAELLQLSSGYMILMVSDGSGNLKSRLWTGSTNKAQKSVDGETILIGAEDYITSYCMATNGTHVLGIYIDNAGNDLKCRWLTGTWSSDPNWGSESNLDTTNLDSTSAVSCTVSGVNNNDFFVFWTYGTSIWMKAYQNGSWGSSTEYITGETGLDDTSFTVAKESYGGVTPIIWVAGSSSPYNIRIELFTLECNVTITSSPTGEDVIEVDGVNYTTPHTFEWNIGSTHSITANSPINVEDGESRYIYINWSDSGSQTHDYIPMGDENVTANYQHQYYLDVIGGNNITGEGWKNSGVNVTSTSNWIWGTITSQKRYAIINYKIDSINQNPVRNNTGIITTSIITMNTYHSVEYINTTQYYTTLTSTIIEFTVSQSGSQTNDNWYDYNTNCTLSATSPQTYAEVTLEFKRWYWKLGNVLQTNSTLNPFNITMVNYVDAKCYWKNPSGGGTVNNYIVSPTQAIEATITSLVTIIRGGTTYNYTSLYLFLFTTGLFIFIVLFMATRKV